MNPEKRILFLTQSGHSFQVENPNWKIAGLKCLLELLQHKSFGGIPHLGAGIIAAEAENIGFRVDIKDLTKLKINETDAQYDKYERIFLSTIDVSVDRLTQWLQKHPNLQQKVVIGGQGITANNVSELMQHFPDVTFVLGRAEGLITQIFQDSSNKHFWYNSDISLTNADKQPYMTNKKSFRDVRLFRYSIIKPEETSTGCTQGCNFCPVAKDKVTYKSIDVVKTEIQKMHLRRNDILLFVDHNLFNLNHNQLTELFTWINEKNISWAGEGTVSQIIHDEELLKLMSENCLSFLVGLEDIPGNNNIQFGSQAKNKLIQEFDKYLEKIRQAKFPVTWSIVFPLNQHNPQSFIYAAKFIKEHKLNTNMHLLCPRNGSVLFDEVEKDERWIQKDSRYRDGLHLVFHPKNMSWEQAMAGFIWLQKKVTSIPWVKERLINNCKELGLKKAVYLMGIELLADKLRAIMLQSMYPELKPKIEEYEAEWKK